VCDRGTSETAPRSARPAAYPASLCPHRVGEQHHSHAISLHKYTQPCGAPSPNESTVVYLKHVSPAVIAVPVLPLRGRCAVISRDSAVGRTVCAWSMRPGERRTMHLRRRPADLEVYARRTRIVLRSCPGLEELSMRSKRVARGRSAVRTTPAESRPSTRALAELSAAARARHPRGLRVAETHALGDLDYDQETGSDHLGRTGLTTRRGPAGPPPDQNALP
jgi:hypothetical protein